MTKSTNTNGKCPHCESNFDAKSAILAFPGEITGKTVSAVFALCPTCNDSFDAGNTKQKTEIIKASFNNVIVQPNIDWTVTSSLALQAHAGNFFNAWCYGVDLPKVVFDAINDGLVDEIVFLPSLANFEGFHHA